MHQLWSLPRRILAVRRALPVAGARLPVTTIILASMHALGAAPMQAQRAERPFAIAVAGGVALPSGAFREVHGDGFQGAASLLVRPVGQRVRFRPEVGLARFRLERVGAGNVDPLDVSPSDAQATARSAGASTTLRDIAADTRHTTLVTGLANVEMPVAGGGYLIGGVGIARVRTTDATAGDEFTANALTYAGGIGWRARIGRIEGYLEARLQRLSIEAGRGYFSDAQVVPVSIGAVF